MTALLPKVTYYGIAACPAMGITTARNPCTYYEFQEGEKRLLGGESLKCVSSLSNKPDENGRNCACRDASNVASSSEIALSYCMVDT